MAVDDLDEDGYLDLVVANSAVNTVSVCYGKGDGTFEVPISYTTSLGPRSVAIGDFDDDFDLDIAVACYTAQAVTPYLATGARTFSRQQDRNLLAPPVAIGAGSFNDDIDTCQDLIIAQEGSTNLRLCRSNCDGTFGSVTYGLGTNTVARDLVVGDFNGDLYDDVAVANQGRNAISVALGDDTDGDGFISNPVHTSASGNPIAIAMEDLDQDGVLDVVTVNASGTASVFYGNGTGAFTPRIDYVAPSSASDIVIVDLDGIADLDIVVASSTTAQVSARLSNGLRTYAPLSQNGQFAVRGPSLHLTYGDMDDDGNDDVVASHYGTSHVSVLPSNGEGGFGMHILAGLGLEHVAAADFDDDGAKDLITAEGTANTVSVHLQGFDGFDAPVSYAVGAGPRAMAAADFDANGSIDIATANQPSASISVLLGDGLGGFAAGSTVVLAVNPTAIAAATIGTDTHIDLIAVATESDQVLILSGRGDATFDSPVFYPTGDMPVAIAIADLDLDKDQDIVVVNKGSNSATVLLADATGALFPAPPLSTGALPSGLAISDLNDDLRQDLVMANSGEQSVSIFLGTGAGSFAPVSTLPIGFNPHSVGFVYADCDRIADLVATGDGTNTVRILLGNGTGTFGPAIEVGAGSLARDLVVGNFDDFGNLDIAVANAGDNTVTLILNNAPCDPPVDVSNASVAARERILWNRPNPFNPETSISFSIGQQQNVRLAIFDLRGRHVRTLWNGAAPSGESRAIWNGRDDGGRPVASGVYLYRLFAGTQVVSRKMTLLR